jgi:predicted LPLAT superfamily acyltransferase
MFLLRNRFAQFDVRVHGKEILDEAKARGEPCFLLGAHFGSFEALHVFGQDHGISVTMMMFERGSRNMNALARTINPDLDRTVIGMGSFDSMIKVQERFERGEWVGMLGDRRIHESGAVSVPFLGATAALPTAPFRLAALIGRPVVLMVALYRGGNRYDLHFERLVEVPKLDRGKRDAMIRECAARYAQRLEHYCRLAPYNWFNFYDFWADADART